MLRLTVLLCGGMFLVLLIAGQDNGQVRQGLLKKPVFAPDPAPVVTTANAPASEPVAKLTEAVFIPAQPIRTALVTQPEPEPVVEVAEPAPPQNKLAVVNARSVNVRSGPSTSDPIIGRLADGEQVLLVVESAPIEGWSLVRIEGDGVEGYVASRLLQADAP
jgi:uncharacterized protein YgiM (DUF1202 family)